MSDHKYKLKYDFTAKSGEFTAEELRTEGVGGADAVLFASIIYPEDGGFSVNFSSMDGRNREALSPREVWKIWMLLASNLAEQTELPIHMRRISQEVMRMAQSLSRGFNEEEKETKH